MTNAVIGGPSVVGSELVRKLPEKAHDAGGTDLPDRADARRESKHDSPPR